MNAMVELETRLYRLEPGDMTRYEFSITPINLEKADCAMFSCLPAEDFVLITIYGPDHQAAYPTSLRQLRRLISQHVYYICEHMRGISNPYHIAAVLLACSVLVYEPENLDKACKRMLDAPGLL